MKPNEISLIGNYGKGLGPRDEEGSIMFSLGESVWGSCGPRVQSLPESGARGKDLDIEDRWIDSVLRFNKALLSYYILRRLVDCDTMAVSFFVAVFIRSGAAFGAWRRVMPTTIG